MVPAHTEYSARRYAGGRGRMETEITFVGGTVETFDPSIDIKLTQFGIEALSREGDDAVRVLFPWAQIEKVTQRGAAVAAVYTW
jgi:hypothetical protein